MVNPENLATYWVHKTQDEDKQNKNTRLPYASKHK